MNVGPRTSTPGLVAMVALVLTAGIHTQTPPKGSSTTQAVLASEGVQLHARAEGAGRPLLVLHGGPGLSSSYLAPDLAFLTDSYRVISYDQRGSGRSTLVTDATRLTLDRHVTDVDAVRRHFGLERAILVGHSWGAVPAAFYARANAERVAALILVDPMPLRRVPWMERFAGNLRKWMDEATARRVEELAAARRNAADPIVACRAYWAIFLRGYMANPHDPSATGRMRGDACNDSPDALANAAVVARAALGPLGEWDWRSEFRTTDVPVLILHGSNDPIPLESAREWQQAFPRATLVSIEDAGHFPYVEQPAAFRRALDAFLAEGRRPGVAARTPARR